MKKRKTVTPRPNQRREGDLVEKSKYRVTIHRQNSVLQKRQMIEFYGMENDTETATVLTTERVK